MLQEVMFWAVTPLELLLKPECFLLQWLASAIPVVASAVWAPIRTSGRLVRVAQVLGSGSWSLVVLPSTAMPVLRLTAFPSVV